MSEPESKKPPQLTVEPGDGEAGQPVGGERPAVAVAASPRPGNGAGAMRGERPQRRAEREALRGQRQGREGRPGGERLQLAARRDDEDDEPRRRRGNGGRRNNGPDRALDRGRADDEDTALDDEEDEGEAEARAPAAPPKAPPPLPETTTHASDAQALRRSRALRLLFRVLAFVVLPTALGTYYYYREASPQYESVSLLTIYSSENIPASANGIDALIGLGSGSNIVTDGLSVREYVFSRDIVRRLDQDEHFLEHLKDPTKDWYSRIPKGASFEEAYDDYDDWVRVEVDPLSGVATLEVRAYSAEASQRFNKAIIHYAEEMVNKLSQRAREDQVLFAEENVKKSEARLSKARQELVRVQQERGEYNPELSAQAQMSIRTALESQVATARAELAQLQAYMTPDAPQVIGAKEKVRSLTAQVAGASQRMVARNEGGQSLNKSVVEFEAVIVEKEFATAAYQAAMGALSVARASAERQHRYLATIAAPSLPDESTIPKRGLGVLTVFLSSLLLMSIGSLLWAGVKEHARL